MTGAPDKTHLRRSKCSVIRVIRRAPGRDFTSEKKRKFGIRLEQSMFRDTLKLAFYRRNRAFGRIDFWGYGWGYIVKGFGIKVFIIILSVASN